GAAFVSGTTIAAEGSYQLVISAVDAAGNRTDRTVSFVLDRSAPVITITGVTAGSFVNGNITPTVIITDAHLTSSSLLLNGATFVSGTTVTVEGNYTLAADATDCAGTRTTRQVAFTIDKTAPTVTLAGFTDGQCGTANVTPTASFADANLATTSLTLDGAAL